jgi:hypothetical protein
MNYPYLGFKVVNDKNNVVFFTSENQGVVVLDETNIEGMTFGTNSEFNEEEYDFLPDNDGNGNELCVRLSN